MHNQITNIQLLQETKVWCIMSDDRELSTSFMNN